MTNIRINMLGGIQIYLDDKNITELFSSKSKALLCYIALEKKREFSREAIASLFWGESNEKASRYNLRYNIWSINKVFQDKSHHLIIGGQDTMYLNDYYNLNTDIDDIQSIYEMYQGNKQDIGRLPEIIDDLYTGTFLESVYLKDCYRFNDWVFFQRENIQKIYFDTLKILESHYTLAEAYTNAIDLLQLMININPLDEVLYLKIIKLYLKQKNKSSATNYYNRCVKVLREELNVSPSKELQALYEQIRTNQISKDYFENNDKNMSIRNKDEYNRIKDEQSGYIIDIEAMGIEGLDYADINQIIEAVISYTDFDNIDDDQIMYWTLLSYINPTIMVGIKKNNTDMLHVFKPLEIALFNALIEVLNVLCKKNSVAIGIKDFEKVDPVSKRFISLLMSSSNRFRGKVWIL